PLTASDQSESTALGWTNIIGQTLSRVAGSRASQFAVEHQDPVIHRQKSGKSRYWVAIGALVLLGIAGAYLAIHNSQSASGRAPLAATSQEDPAPVESPPVEVEAQTGPSDAADASEDHSSPRPEPAQQVQKQNQSTKEPRTSPPANDVAPPAQT